MAYQGRDDLDDGAVGHLAHFGLIDRQDKWLVYLMKVQLGYGSAILKIGKQTGRAS